MLNWPICIGKSSRTIHSSMRTKTFLFVLPGILWLPQSISMQATAKDRSASESIIVARYVGQRPLRKSKDDTADCVGLFKLIAVVKGPPFGITIPVRYYSSKLPPVQSKWILFIDPAVPQQGVYQTIGGSAGRIAFTKENLDLTLNELRSSDPNYHLRDAELRALEQAIAK